MLMVDEKLSLGEERVALKTDFGKEKYTSTSLWVMLCSEGFWFQMEVTDSVLLIVF